MTVGEKLRLVPGLLKYMIPLGLVYLFEYFINQGLVSIIIVFCDSYRYFADDSVNGNFRGEK